MPGAGGRGTEKFAVSLLGDGVGVDGGRGERPPHLEGWTGVACYEKAVSLLNNPKRTGSTEHDCSQ